ncbi:hypothetical protein CR513_62740, partial [Mucuna pruriens]
MHNINIVLNNSIPSLEIKPMSSSLSIAPSKPEESTPTNNRHLPDLVEDAVPPQDGDGAAIVLPFNEGKVHGHEKINLALRSRGVEPLSLSHQLGTQLGPQRQRIVDHVHQAEGRRGVQLRRRRNNRHRRGVASAHYVVPVEPEMAQLFLPLKTQHLAVYCAPELGVILTLDDVAGEEKEE